MTLPTNILRKLSHCYFPYPRVLGQFQFNDSIIQSSRKSQATTESSFFYRAVRQMLGGRGSSGLALRKLRAHLKYCPSLYSLYNHRSLLYRHTSLMIAFLLTQSTVISGIPFLITETAILNMVEDRTAW